MRSEQRFLGRGKIGEGDQEIGGSLVTYDLGGSLESLVTSVLGSLATSPNENLQHFSGEVPRITCDF